MERLINFYKNIKRILLLTLSVDITTKALKPLNLKI